MRPASLPSLARIEREALWSLLPLASLMGDEHQPEAIREAVPASLLQELHEIQERQVLRRLHLTAIRCDSLEAFRQALQTGGKEH